MEYPEYSLLLRSPQRRNGLFEPDMDDESGFVDFPDDTLDNSSNFDTNEKFEDLTNDLISYLEKEECFNKLQPMVSPNVMLIQKNQVGYKFMDHPLPSLSSFTEDYIDPPLTSVGTPVSESEFGNYDLEEPIALRNSFILQPKNSTLIPADFMPLPNETAMPLPLKKEPSLVDLPLPLLNGKVIDLNQTVQRNLGNVSDGRKKHILKISSSKLSTNTQKKSTRRKKKKKKKTNKELYVPPPPPPPKKECITEPLMRYKRSKIMTRSATKNDFKHESIQDHHRRANMTRKLRISPRKASSSSPPSLSKKKIVKKKKKKSKNTSFINSGGRNVHYEENNNNNNKKRRGKLRILKDRTFQKRKLRKDAMISKTKGRKDERGKLGKSYDVKLKPCRRINTDFADSGMFPYYVCSAPYKYILQITAPDSFDEQDYEFYLKTFRHPHNNHEGGGDSYEFDEEEDDDDSESSDEEDDHSDGLEVTIKKVTFEAGKVVQLYHMQFMMTSFLNQSVEFRLCVNDDRGESVFKSAKFKIVARKVKFEDDRFWNQFLLKMNNNNNNNQKKKKMKKKKKTKKKEVNSNKRRTGRKRKREEEEEEENGYYSFLGDSRMQQQPQYQQPERKKSKF